MSRHEQLLASVASDLDDGQSPMSEAWLRANDVSFDECGAVRDKLALIVRGYLNAPRHLRLAVLACSAADNRGEGSHFAAILERDHSLKSLT